MKKFTLKDQPMTNYQVSKIDKKIARKDVIQKVFGSFSIGIKKLPSRTKLYDEYIKTKMGM